FSLMLGLERVLSVDEPKLADGTVLSAHQVDVLSGTLTALIAEAGRQIRNGRSGNGRPPDEALVDVEPEPEPELDAELTENGEVDADEWLDDDIEAEDEAGDEDEEDETDEGE